MQKNQSQPSASVQLMNNQPEVKIFISHSSADAAVAESVAELFRAALNLRAEEIRCTRSLTA
jgi:hypothetical protein